MIGGGAIFNSVTRKDLESQLLVRPSDSAVIKFEEMVGPMDKQIYNFHLQNDRLSEARELLLPRLMNGSIEV